MHIQFETQSVHFPNINLKVISVIFKDLLSPFSSEAVNQVTSLFSARGKSIQISRYVKAAYPRRQF